MARFTLALAFSLVLFCSALELVRAYWELGSCISANGYDDDRFMSNCGGAKYADYEHGAYYFGSERMAIDALKAADVLFLGNSRMQIGFSTDATRAFFKRIGVTHYLFGFGYVGNVVTARLLIERWGLTAKVVVINVDESFFSTVPNAPTNEILEAPVRARYVTYHQALGQYLQRTFQDHFSENATVRRPHLGSVFRSRRDGAWSLHFPAIDNFIPIGKEEDSFIGDRVSEYTVAKLRTFLPSDAGCTIIVYVPSLYKSWTGAPRVANLMRATFVSSEIQELGTLDGQHLTKNSAEKWSAAILNEMAPTIRRCVGRS